MRRIPKRRKEPAEPKRYFVSFKKGKYILLPLSVKKKGHAQKY